MALFFKSLLLITFFYSSCVYDPPKEAIWVKNNSAKAIYLYGTCLNRLDSTPVLYLYIYQKINGVASINSPPYRIPPYETKQLFAWQWQSQIEKCPDGRYKLFVIKEEELKSNTWDEIWKNQKYSKVISFDFQELKVKNEFIIIDE